MKLVECVKEIATQLVIYDDLIQFAICLRVCNFPNLIIIFVSQTYLREFDIQSRNICRGFVKYVIRKKHLVSIPKYFIEDIVTPGVLRRSILRNINFRQPGKSMSVEFKDTRVGLRPLTLPTISGGHLWNDWFGLKMGYKSTKLAMCIIWITEIWLVLWYSYVICFHHIVLEVNYSLYCDFPKFSLVWNLVLYHVLETNWWFLI